MNYEIKKLPGSTLEATVTVEASAVAAEQEKVINKLVKTVTVQGFRKGAAPLNIAKKHLDPKKVMDETINNLVDASYREILTKENPDLFFQPEVTKCDFEEGNLVVVFKLIVRPEVTLETYKGFEVIEDVAIVNDEEINAELVKIQEKNAEIAVKDGAVENGDIAVIDFEGFVDGEAFEGGKAEKYELTIGSNTFIPGFEDQIVGMVAGEDKDINVVFPEAYAAHLASKPAVFKVHLHEVKHKNLPELNDDLALDANIENVSTLEELKAHIVDSLQEGKKANAHQKAIDELITKIADTASVDLPERMIEEEFQNELKNFKSRLSQNGLGYEQYLELAKKEKDDVEKEIKEASTKRLKVAFVMGHVAKLENITVSEEDFNAKIEEYCQAYGGDIATMKEQLEKIDPRYKNQIMNEIFNQKVIDVIESVNTIK